MSLLWNMAYNSSLRSATMNYTKDYTFKYSRWWRNPESPHHLTPCLIFPVGPLLPRSSRVSASDYQVRSIFQESARDLGEWGTWHRYFVQAPLEIRNAPCWWLLVVGKDNQLAFDAAPTLQRRSFRGSCSDSNFGTQRKCFPRKNALYHVL